MDLGKVVSDIGRVTTGNLFDDPGVGPKKGGDGHYEREVPPRSDDLSPPTGPDVQGLDIRIGPRPPPLRGER